MGMLSDEHLAKLRIERMIFHVVGPSKSDLLLMDEVDVGGLGDFFLERVKETNIGNRFNFIGIEQGVYPSLKAIADNPKRFVDVSKKLAELFKAQHEVVASKKGAFIVAKLSGLSGPAYALIKFDDLRVLRFRHEKDKAGAVKATVTEIDNTFQEDRKAMQKSALIVMTPDGGDLAVYDRTNRKNITDYFRAFLGVKRLYTPEEATTRLADALNAAFSQHKGEATKEIRATWKNRLYDATRKLEAVEPEKNLESFGSAVFGTLWSSEAFRSTLEKEMQKAKISGEAIEIAPKIIGRPNVRRVSTFEGIQIRVPASLSKSQFEIKEQANGRAVITIHTQEIIDNELVAEAADSKAD